MMAIEEWPQPDEILATDASLNGCGGWNAASRQFFHTLFPLMITKQDLHIYCLELLTIIVAVKIWGHEWSGKRIMVQCDNMTSVTFMNPRRSKYPFLQDCLRELAYISARHQVEIRVVRIPGVTNRIPNALSRWELDPRYKKEFWQLVGSGSVFEQFVYEGLFQFSHNW